MKILDQRTILNDINLKKSGVYKIYLYKKGKPIPIYRFLNYDKSGLIYIGATEKTSIHYRLSCFLNSINPIRKQNNHSAGNKISKNKKLNQLIANSDLMFEFILTNQAKKYEKKELKDYRDLNGEVPPLNG